MSDFPTIEVPSAFVEMINIAQTTLGKRILVVGVLSLDGANLELMFNPTLSDREVASVSLSLHGGASKSP